MHEMCTQLFGEAKSEKIAHFLLELIWMHEMCTQLFGEAKS